MSIGCILLLSFVVSSSAAPARVQGLSSEESDFPFEFSTAKGSVVTADNVLTQSVSSDGDAVFKENSPQPIKKYGSKKMTGGSGKKTQKVQSANYWPESNQKTSKNPKPQGNKHTTVFEFPEKREGSSSHAVSYAAAAPASGASQWDVMENMLYKYIYPGTTGRIKITYLN